MNQGHRPRGPHHGLAVAGVMVTAGGLLIMLVLGHSYRFCQSFLGQLAQAGSQQNQATCNSGSAVRRGF